MAALDDLMRMVGEVVNASNAVWSAQARGETWEECTDQRKHYAAVTCALEDVLRNMLQDRITLEYEATQLMTAMTDVLAHFTRTPSTLQDSEVRGMGHAANARMRAVLLEQTGNTLYAVNHGTPCRDDGRCQYAIEHGAEGIGSCPDGRCILQADYMPAYSQSIPTMMRRVWMTKDQIKKMQSESDATHQIQPDLPPQ